MTDWRAEGVVVRRAAALAEVKASPLGAGRATVFDFQGSGGARTWIGSVTLAPGAATGAHHHGRHEVALFVVRGRAQIRWGERLELAADLEAGDFAYFPPFVPHEERNPDAREPAELLAIRSDNERIAVKLDTVPADSPETVA